MRPRSMDPIELGFVPRRPVSWLEQHTLQQLQARLTGSAPDAADTREVQASAPDEICDLRDEGELWFDYLAGTGDGFDATYTTAYLLAEPELTVAGHTLPTGRLLVLGGELVQPSASRLAYRDRLLGPLEAAAPAADGVRERRLLALPGFSDWSDGLVAFRRTFTRPSVGAWRTGQPRSYFAVLMPGRWCLLAVDLSGAGAIDEPQARYFRRVAERLAPGDRVIICVARAGWLHVHRDPEAYDAIDDFISTVVAPTGAVVRLLLGADERSYTRYEGPDRSWITCGSGGSYTTSTDQLPHIVTVPPAETLSRTAGRSREARHVAGYPSRREGRRLGVAAIRRFVVANPGYAALLGAVHLGLMLALTDLPTPLDPVLLALAVTAVVSVLMPGRFGSVSDMLPRAASFGLPLAPATLPQRLLVMVHVVLQVALGFAGTELWRRTPLFGLDEPWPFLLSVLVYTPVMAVVATAAGATYLWTIRRAGRNADVFYAASAVRDFKCFLRLHVPADGSLVVYAVAADRVGTGWVARPDDEPHRPWLAPDRPISVRLAEPPVLLD